MQTPTASKTPVSLLQELSMRRGISPKYDLLQIEGPAHEPTFVYRVTVGEFEATGSGQTKKRAKHIAAKEVLDTIIQGGTSTGTSTTPAARHTEIPSEIFPTYDDGIAGNPIGSLQELCTSRRLPPPAYDLTAEEGYPHEKTFAISCCIGQYREVGTGKSKKLAKRQAADKMLQKLKNQPVDQSASNVLADEDEEVKSSLNSLPLAVSSHPLLTELSSSDLLDILNLKLKMEKLAIQSLGNEGSDENSSQSEASEKSARDPSDSMCASINSENSAPNSQKTSDEEPYIQVDGLVKSEESSNKNLPFQSNDVTLSQEIKNADKSHSDDSPESAESYALKSNVSLENALKAFLIQM